jgi:hypothetical protein
MTDSHPSRTGVLLTTRRFPLAWLFWTFKTDVSIDGEAAVVPWGTHFYQLAPGRHSIRVGFRFMWGKDMGADEVECDVVQGQTTTVTYRSPFLVTSAGSIRVG